MSKYFFGKSKETCLKQSKSGKIWGHICVEFPRAAVQWRSALYGGRVESAAVASNLSNTWIDLKIEQRKMGRMNQQPDKLIYYFEF